MIHPRKTTILLIISSTNYRMARKGVQPMGIVSMIVLLVAAVAVLPWVVRMLVRSVSGFEDAPAAPQMGVSQGRGYVPDANTDYICSSPDGSSDPCPEGQFCNGATKSCQQKTVPAMGGIDGYFS